MKEYNKKEFEENLPSNTKDQVNSFSKSFIADFLKNVPILVKEKDNLSLRKLLKMLETFLLGFWISNDIMCQLTKLLMRLIDEANKDWINIIILDSVCKSLTELSKIGFKRGISLDVSWKPIYYLLSIFLQKSEADTTNSVIILDSGNNSPKIVENLRKSVIKLAEVIRIHYSKSATSEIISKFSPEFNPFSSRFYEIQLIISILLPTQSNPSTENDVGLWFNLLIDTLDWNNMPKSSLKCIFSLYSRAARFCNLDFNKFWKPILPKLYHVYYNSLNLPSGLGRQRNTNNPNEKNSSWPSRAQKLADKIDGYISRYFMIIVIFTMNFPRHDISKVENWAGKDFEYSFKLFSQLCESLKLYFHNSGRGKWSSSLSILLGNIGKQYQKFIRLNSITIPANSENPFMAFVKESSKLAVLAFDSNNIRFSETSVLFWKNVAEIHPTYIHDQAFPLIMPYLLPEKYNQVNRDIKSYKVDAALASLSNLSGVLFYKKEDNSVLLDILFRTLPEINTNNLLKTAKMLSFHGGIFSEFKFISEMELKSKKYENQKYLCSEPFCERFMDTYLIFISKLSKFDPISKFDKYIIQFISRVLKLFFQSVSEGIFDNLSEKLIEYWEDSSNQNYPKKYMSAFAKSLGFASNLHSNKVISSVIKRWSELIFKSEGSEEKENNKFSDKYLSNLLYLLGQMLRNCNSEVILQNFDNIEKLILFTFKKTESKEDTNMEGKAEVENKEKEKKFGCFKKNGRKLLLRVLENLNSSFPLEYSSFIARNMSNNETNLKIIWNDSKLNGKNLASKLLESSLQIIKAEIDEISRNNKNNNKSSQKFIEILPIMKTILKGGMNYFNTQNDNIRNELIEICITSINSSESLTLSNKCIEELLSLLSYSIKTTFKRSGKVFELLKMTNHLLNSNKVYTNVANSYTYSRRYLLVEKYYCEYMLRSILMNLQTQEGNIKSSKVLSRIEITAMTTLKRFKEAKIQNKLLSDKACDILQELLMVCCQDTATKLMKEIGDLLSDVDKLHVNSLKSLQSFYKSETVILILNENWNVINSSTINLLKGQKHTDDEIQQIIYKIFVTILNSTNFPPILVNGSAVDYTYVIRNKKHWRYQLMSSLLVHRLFFLNSPLPQLNNDIIAFILSNINTTLITHIRKLSIKSLSNIFRYTASLEKSSMYEKLKDWKCLNNIEEFKKLLVNLEKNHKFLKGNEALLKNTDQHSKIVNELCYDYYGVFRSKSRNNNSNHFNIDHIDIILFLLHIDPKFLIICVEKLVDFFNYYSRTLQSGKNEGNSEYENENRISFISELFCAVIKFITFSRNDKDFSYPTKDMENSIKLIQSEILPNFFEIVSTRFSNDLLNCWINSIYYISSEPENYNSNRASTYSFKWVLNPLVCKLNTNVSNNHNNSKMIGTTFKLVRTLIHSFSTSNSEFKLEFGDSVFALCKSYTTSKQHLDMITQNPLILQEFSTLLAFLISSSFKFNAFQGLESKLESKFDDSNKNGDGLYYQLFNVDNSSIKILYLYTCIRSLQVGFNLSTSSIWSNALNMLLPFLNLQSPSEDNKSAEGLDSNRVIELMTLKSHILNCSSWVASTNSDQALYILQQLQKIPSDKQFNAYSRKTKLEILAFVKNWTPRHQFLLNKKQYRSMVQLVVLFMKDSVLEVRDTACVTLSHLLQNSTNKVNIGKLRKQFLNLGNGDKSNKELDCGVLGICSMVYSTPFNMDEFTVSNLVYLSKFKYEKGAISSQVKNCISEFLRTHHEEWESKWKLKFESHELDAIQEVNTAPSYFA